MPRVAKHIPGLRASPWMVTSSTLAPVGSPGRNPGRSRGFPAPVGGGSPKPEVGGAPASTGQQGHGPGHRAGLVIRPEGRSPGGGGGGAGRVSDPSVTVTVPGEPVADSRHYEASPVAGLTPPVLAAPGSGALSTRGRLPAPLPPARPPRASGDGAYRAGPGPFPAWGKGSSA